MRGALPVTPAQPGELTAAHPCGCRQVQSGVEAEMSRGGQELDELVGGPALRAGALARLGSRWLGGVGDVGGNEVLSLRVVERGANDDVYVIDGLGCEAAGAFAAGGEQLGVEAVEVLGLQRPQRQRPEGGADVAVDHPLVPVRRGGRQSLSSAGHPPFGQVAAKRELVGCDDVLCVFGCFQARFDRIRVGAGVPRGMPSPSFPSGGGVGAVVADDVEAVLALHDVSHHDPSTRSERTRRAPGSDPLERLPTFAWRKRSSSVALAMLRPVPAVRW